MKKRDGLFCFGSSKHDCVMCEIFSKSLNIFKFSQERQRNFNSKNFGHVLGNWFLADLVKVIGVAVHTSKSRKVKKSDY